MQSISPITEADFLRLTGLKPVHGKACIDRYNGCIHTTLAAVVQSRTRIPVTAFEKKDAIAVNSDEINVHLTKVYAEVRKRINENSKLELKEAWAGLAKPAAPTANATAAAPAANTAIKFGFGAAPTAGVPVKFGFGAAPASAAGASTTPAAASGFAFGFGKPPVAPVPAPQASAASPVKKPVVYANPTYPTGQFLNNPDFPKFWDKEVLDRSTIFNLDKGFVSRNKDQLRERMLKWAKPCMAFYGGEIKYAPITDRDEETARVILRDADRTFFETCHREKFAEFLHSMLQELNTYGQSMSYLAAICSLGLTERETAAILRKTAKEVLQGHWAAEAVGFASNAWVFEHILSKMQPDLAKHFNALNFWPDMYLQKIFSGLCVHVLAFEQLFDFLDKFMAEGLSFLFRFALGITQVFRTTLLTTDHFDTLFSIMRLDSSMVTAEDVKQIMAAAEKIDIRDYPLQELKSEKYNDKILPRLEKAPKTLEFEPCTLCEVNKPSKYCEEHGVACDECAAKYPDTEWEDW